MSDSGERWAIGVGANLGDRARAHDEAARLLGDDGLVRIVARSRRRETAPVGGPSGQPAFLNAAWVVESGLGAHQLLHRLQGVEARLGRAREVRDGPRTIDLDLLLREDGLIVESAVLTLPHPRMHERAFVLEPLVEVAAAWRHPRLRLSIAELRARATAAAGRDDDGAVRERIWIAASPARVFRALVAADELPRWWPTDAISDPRPDGALTLVWANGGRCETRFALFAPDREIAYPFYGEWLRFSLAPRNGGTDLLIEHACDADARAHVAECWASLAPALKGLLESG